MIHEIINCYPTLTYIIIEFLTWIFFTSPFKFIFYVSCIIITFLFNSLSFGIDFFILYLKYLKNKNEKKINWKSKQKQL